MNRSASGGDLGKCAALKGIVGGLERSPGGILGEGIGAGDTEARGGEYRPARVEVICDLSIVGQSRSHFDREYPIISAWLTIDRHRTPI